MTITDGGIPAGKLTLNFPAGRTWQITTECIPYGGQGYENGSSWILGNQRSFLPIGEAGRIYLRATVDYDKLQFYYSTAGEEGYEKIGPVLDASILSDEACNEGWFTGAMVGICCQDLTGFCTYADFDYFEYLTYVEC